MLMAAAACLALLAPAGAAPSLDPKASTTVAIKVGTRRVEEGGRTVTKDVFRYYTCIMDHEKPQKWYYLPPSLVLADDSDGLPTFDLVRYQLSNPAGGAPLEGGILQFAVAQDLSGFNGAYRQKVLSRLASVVNSDAELRKKHNLGVLAPNDINLGAMPFEDVSVALFAPGKGTFLSGVSMQEGSGPKYGGQSLPFTLELTTPGTSVYEALTTGRTGVNVLYNVSFLGVTPPVGISVTVNLEEAIKHFSNAIENRQSMAANIFGVDLEAAVGVSNLDVLNELKKNDVIDIKVTTSAEGFDEKAAMAYLTPLLEKIYQEILVTSPVQELFTPTQAEKIGRNEDIKFSDLREGEKKKDSAADKTSGEEASKASGAPPAEAADGPAPADGGGNTSGGGAGDEENVVPNVIPRFKTETNIGIKKINQLTKKELKWDLTFQSYRKKQTVIGGFIGLDMKGFTPEERARFIRDAGDSKAFSQSSFRLPVIEKEYADRLGITEIGLYVTLNNEKGEQVRPQMGATYVPGQEKWTGESVKPGPQGGAFLQFLTGEFATKPEFRKYRFKVKAYVDRSPITGFDKRTKGPKRDPLPRLHFDYGVPLLTGASGLASPLSNLRRVEIDPSALLQDYGNESIDIEISAVVKDDQGKDVDQSFSVRNLTSAVFDTVFFNDLVLLLPPASGSYNPSASIYVKAPKWKRNDTETAARERLLQNVTRDVELVDGLRNWITDESAIAAFKNRKQ